jgi:hypothetical protein
VPTAEELFLPTQSQLLATSVPPATTHAPVVAFCAIQNSAPDCMNPGELICNVPPLT